MDGRDCYYTLPAHEVISEFEAGTATAARAPLPSPSPSPSPATAAWHLSKFNIPGLWAKYGTRGAGVRVAVLDTGVDPGHPALATGVVAAYDYSAGASGAVAAALGRAAGDQQGHGTHVCGIVCGASTGVAPEAAVLSVKVFGADGSAQLENILRALRDIRDGVIPGVDVVNMSLGSPLPCEEMRVLLLELVARGVIVICAAGNAGAHDAVQGAPRFGTMSYPAAFAGTVAVGSLNERNGRSQFSSTGPMVAVMAPGEAIASTWVRGGSALLSGTSMAAPFVTGCVALLISACRARRLEPPGNDGLQYLLAATSADLESRGYDAYTGNGCLAPDALISKHIERARARAS